MPNADPFQVRAETDCPVPSRCTLLRSAAEFEAPIADLSSRFVNLAPEEVDREIEDALRQISEPLGIDLAVLWQWSDAPSVIVPTHAWCAVEGLRPSVSERGAASARRAAASDSGGYVNSRPADERKPR